MKIEDWVSFSKKYPEESDYPILIESTLDYIWGKIDSKDQLLLNKNFTHWQPYITPRGPDTATSLLEEVNNKLVTRNSIQSHNRYIQKELGRRIQRFVNDNPKS